MKRSYFLFSLLSILLSDSILGIHASAAEIVNAKSTPSRKATTQDRGTDYSTSEITKVVLIGVPEPIKTTLVISEVE
jgi:hypothetical protein